MATETTEVWVAVEGYEGLYEVSNLGRVQSVDRYVPYKDGTRFYKGRILRPATNNKGYLQVMLCKGGKVRAMLLHRLVAAAFCAEDRHDGCDVVNHKDNDPNNNRADNLEYTTNRGNTLHAILSNRIVSRAVIRSDGKYYPILSTVKDDGFWPSAVIKCCNGKQRMHKGYGWNYACLLPNGSYGKISRAKLGTTSQNIQSKEDVNHLKKNANHIRLPELGMQAVFAPTIYGSFEKKAPPPPVRGYVTQVNERHGLFTVEYPVELGTLRETFKFVDVGSRVRLYKP